MSNKPLRIETHHPLHIEPNHPLFQHDLAMFTITVDWFSISSLVDGAVKDIPTHELTKIIDEFNKAIDMVAVEMEGRR